MKVILDTNFILTCIKERIDFLEADNYGEIFLPIQVINELKEIKENGSLKERNNAEIALKIIEKNKLKTIKLDNEFVDAGIIDYVKSNSDVILATLDRELKKTLKNKVKILAIKNRKIFL